MSLCLYDCLRAVGLQHHYASFTSLGIGRAAHLSALTMEDYPILGIRSMEDRSRLFHLVQMVKTLDLEYEDTDDYDADESYDVADSSFTFDGCGDPDEDVYDDEDEDVRRRLDFSGKTVDHPLSRPEGPIHVPTSCNRKNIPSQSKGSATLQKSNNHRLGVYSHQSDHHREKNTLSNIKEENAMNSSSSRSSTFFSFHKLKPRPATVASNWFSNRPVGIKDRKGISKKEKLYPEMSSNEATEHTAKPTPVYESKRTAGYNYGLPLSCPLAANENRQADVQRISVCVRKRPLTRTECRGGQVDVVTTPRGECVIINESKEALDLTQYILQHRFDFDLVFGEESSNEEVYQRTAYPLVQHMLKGGNATCFAYGQTGAGKTHTMLGSSPVRPGLYALAVRDIFAFLSTTHTHSPLLVYVSFFEIYCGQLYDLLDHRKRLFAREDGQKVVHIVGLRDVRVDSVNSLLGVISRGIEERTQGMTGVNPLSSRSHALLQIQLKDPHQQIAGRMWFVDLAGSERASDTKDPDKRSRMEGAEINQSLLALKECIRSLDQKQSHTPFRQSKLTQVLKDAFVGDSMTCMIANISPGHLATEHTLNTLRYVDRVKELRILREKRGRQGKIIPAPKRNLSNSSNSSGGNSVGTRGKSPPKKPKLGRQREDFGPNTLPKNIATRGTILCSTPKKSRWEEERSASTRKGIDLEHITPIRGLLGISDKLESAGRRKTYGVTEIGGRSISDRNAAGLVLGQATDEPLKESGFYHRDILRGGVQEERRQIEQRRQVERSEDTSNKVERQSARDLQKVDEQYKERERHLRQYHQQLQQFMPSPAFPSVHPCLSSSYQASLYSSASPSSSLQHSSRLSVSAPMCNGLEEVLDTYRATECGQSSFFPGGGRRRDEVGHGDTGGADCRISRESIETRFGQDRGKNEKRRSVTAAREEVRVRGRPACMDGGGKRRWAWAADGMTDSMPADEEALVGEEGPDASDVSLLNEPSVESSQPRAPAERPLSPACEHTNALLTPIKLSDLSLDLRPIRCPSNILSLPLQNDAKRREISAALPPPNAQNGCKTSAELLTILSESPVHIQVHNHPEVKAKMSVLPQEESAESSSYIMDPLSISLLEADQQVATASFLQGEQNTSLCPSESESRGDNGRKVIKERLTCAELDGKVAEDEDVEFRRSLTYDTMPATRHTEGRKGLCCTTYEHCEIGMMKLPFPNVMLVSLQDQEDNFQPQTTPAIEVPGNKTPASPPKPSTCASMQTPVAPSISSSVQQPRNTGLPSSHNLTTNGATQLPPEYAHNTHAKVAFSISPQSESALGQLNKVSKQCHTVHSNGSNSSLQPNGHTERNSEESPKNHHIRPKIHQSALEDLNHGQRRVVQAHWEQLEEMDALWHKDGTLLCQQPDMAFGEYVQKLENIMERKARCVHSMIAQLQPYLKLSQSNQLHSQEEHNHDPNTKIFAF